MTSPREGRETSLLRLYAWIVLLVTLLTLAVGLVVALQRPVTYTSETKVQVLPEQTRGAPITPDMGTERELATSGSVAADAARRLGSSPRRALQGLSVSVVTDTAVLVVDYSAGTAREAYAGAEAFTASYLDARNARQKLRVATLITRPGVPTQSTGSGYVLVLGVALVAGLALGCAVAWLWDRLSDRVRTSPELERTGRPVLASRVSLPRRATGITSAGLEDFAYLAGRLNAATNGRRDGVRILVTAPRAQSGASAVALNVAAGVAGLGRSVVLVDADVRATGISALLPGRPVPGLTEVLAGAVSVDEVLRPLWLDRVQVVPSAVRKPPPLLDVDLVGLVLTRMAAHDIVVIDGPPLLEAPEAMLLAGHVDVVLVVGDLHSLTRSDADRAAELLRPLSETLVGWVTHLRRTSARHEGEQQQRPRPVSPGDRPEPAGEHTPSNEVGEPLPAAHPER